MFPQLSQAEIVQIVDLMIDRLSERLADKDMAIELTQDAKELLAKRGYDPVLGARPLRRAIQREIEDVISEKILYGEFAAGDIIEVDVDAPAAEETAAPAGPINPGASGSAAPVGPRGFTFTSRRSLDAKPVDQLTGDADRAMVGE